MSLDDDIFLKADEHVRGKLTLRELFEWVFDREPYWGEAGRGKDSAKLANAIELAVFEVQAGDRDEESARDLIAEELANLTASRRS